MPEPKPKPTAATPKGRRRNILFITTDQQRYDTIGVNGGTLSRTPHLDALAREVAARRKDPYAAVRELLAHADRLRKIE